MTETPAGVQVDQHLDVPPNDGHYADGEADISVVTAPPEPVWDPLKTLAPKTHVLEVARAHGVEMSITLRPWTAKHRLMYEDLSPTLQVAVPDQLDDEGDALQMMKLGSLKLLGTALTVIGSAGFAMNEDGRPFLSGDLNQRRMDLAQITDPALYEEIIEAAITFEPLPGSNRDRKRIADARSGVKDDDPSQTPSKPVTATAPTDTPGSPAE